MSNNSQQRTKILLGSKAGFFPSFRVAVFGIGGVGGYTAEALARCGIGTIALIDRDVVDESNINRQIVALSSTIGQSKAEIMKKRILDINPDCKVTAYNEFYGGDNHGFINLKDFDYIADCIDSVPSKVFLITECKKLGVPVISVMGAGNKLNTDFKAADIYKTSVCPLCKIMRKQLKDKGVTSLDVIYSEELPLPADNELTTVNCATKPRKAVIGSISYVPAAAGLKAAEFIIKKLLP